MTIEEKAKAIENACMKFSNCTDCPLFNIPEIERSEENCFTLYGLPINVDRNYAVLFGTAEEVASFETNHCTANPYWKAIEALAEKQRAKGISKYGKGLEMNPMGILERLTYLEEELVDGLFYIEHIKAWLMEKGYAE